MLNTLILRMNQSQFPKMDNLTIKDKMPAPKLSVIGKFHSTENEMKEARYNLFCSGKKIVNKNCKTMLPLLL